jgi:hypothetical protein
MGTTASRARGGQRRGGPGDGVGQRHHELRNGAWCTTSWAQGRQHCCGLRNDIAGLGSVPAWSMASLAWVGEDGCE